MKKILALLLVFAVMTLCGFAALAETAATETAETAAETVEAAEAPAEETAEPAAEEEEESYTGIGTVSSMIAIAVMLVIMAVLIVLSAKRVKWNAAMIAKAAMCIALAYALSLVRLFRMPQGGSVTLVAMLPIILFSVSFGPMEGLVAGFAFGILELLIDPYVIHPIQLLVDYPMAYGAVALASAARLIKNEKLQLPIAVILGYLGRYFMATLSGVVFFAEYAGPEGALIYSLVYNGSYLGPEALICAVLMLIPGMTRLPAIVRGGNMRKAR